jgi:hypothetical protein
VRQKPGCPAGCIPISRMKSNWFKNQSNLAVESIFLDVIVYLIMVIVCLT